MSDRSLVDVTELVLDILSQDPLGPGRRQAFVDLTEADVAVLRRLHPLLASGWSKAVQAVLDRAGRQPELATLLSADAARVELRAELLGHARDVTSGDYDESWLAEGIRIGLQSAEAGVPPDWLASAWAIAFGELVPAVRAALGDDVESFTLGITALLKVAFLDIGMLLHTRAHLDREAMTGLRQFARTVLESVPDGIVLTDAGGRILQFNAAAERIFGAERTEVQGKPFAELLHEANRDEEARGRRQLFEDGGRGSPGSRRSNARAPVQMTGLRADGATVPVEVTFQVGTLDGEPVCCAAVRDVSERVHSEHALRRSEANFRALIEGSPDAILVYRGATIVYANPGFLRLLAVPDLRSLIGRPVADFLAPGDRRVLFPSAEDAAAWAHRLEHGSAPREVRFVRGDAEVVTETREFALDFDAEPAIVLVARDVTERHRLAARMYEMDRAISVGNLAAAAGHEINNPLTYILGNTQFARHEIRRLATQLRTGASEGAPLDDLALRLDEVARALDEAQEGAVRVRTTVASLRSMARREDDAIGRRLKLEAVIDAAVAVVWNEIRHRARLERQYMAAPAVFGSEARLTQVFVHLLMNAALSIPEGAIEANEIRITMYADGDRVHVEVADSGCGMAPEVATRAFEPFFTTRPTGEAAGLGLTISRQIVEAAGGTLTVSSAPDFGTTTRVVLPAAGEADRPPRTTQPLSAPCRPGRLLLIDDEPSIASAFRHVVDDVHTVTTFTSARDALRRLEAGERWDVIFCDLHMPDMTGMQFHEALCGFDATLAARTVYLTGGAFTGEARAFLRAVPNHCVDKPFDGIRIGRLLAELIPSRAGGESGAGPG
jgi:PAS domain S-box-containing protein